MFGLHSQKFPELSLVKSTFLFHGVLVLIIVFIIILHFTLLSVSVTLPYSKLCLAEHSY